MQLKNGFGIFMSLALGCVLAACGGGGGSSETATQVAGSTVANVGVADPLPPEVRSLVSQSPVMPASAQLSGNVTNDVLTGRWATACVPNKQDSAGGYIVYVADIHPTAGAVGTYAGQVSFYTFGDARCLQPRSTVQYSLRASAGFMQFSAIDAATWSGVPYDANTPYTGGVEQWDAALFDANQNRVFGLGLTIGTLPGGASALVQMGDLVWPTANAVLAVKL